MNASRRLLRASMRGKASAVQIKDTSARTAIVAVARAIELDDGARCAKEFS